jgi:hypothetical protein
MSCSVTRGISNARRAVVANEGAAAACGAKRTGAHWGKDPKLRYPRGPNAADRKHGRQPMRACKAGARPECKRACARARVCVCV